MTVLDGGTLVQGSNLLWYEWALTAAVVGALRREERRRDLQHSANATDIQLGMFKGTFLRI
jgi:hypothetical protein